MVTTCVYTIVGPARRSCYHRRIRSGEPPETAANKRRSIETTVHVKTPLKKRLYPPLVSAQRAPGRSGGRLIGVRKVRRDGNVSGRNDVTPSGTNASCSTTTYRRGGFARSDWTHERRRAGTYHLENYSTLCGFPACRVRSSTFGVRRRHRPTTTTPKRVPINSDQSYIFRF